jgi:enamine deaminase RidA (YjgF/YER057c/UK114 family)
MAALKHFNPKAGAPPYKGLFSTVTVVPPNTSLAYISSQWAADANGELVEGTAGDYAKQVKITWEHVIGILKELGVDFKSVVHRTINFLSVFPIIYQTVLIRNTGNLTKKLARFLLRRH